MSARMKEQEVYLSRLTVDITSNFDLLSVDGLLHVSHGEDEIRRMNILVSDIV